MDRNRHMSELLDEALSGRISRRDVLRRAIALGLSIPAIGAILAACGDDDDDSDGDATAGTGGNATTGTGANATSGTGTGAATATTATGSGGAATEVLPTATTFVPTQAPPAVANAEAAKAYTGASLTYYGDGVGIGHDLDLAVTKAFADATGINVEVIPRPTDATETYATYQRAFESQSGDIDVMMLDIIWPGAFAPHLVDLSPAFPDTSIWYESIVTNNTIDGKLVGAPWFGDFGILFYRTDLLEKYEYDGPPETWDELQEMAQKIMDGEKAANQNFTGFVFQGKAYEGLTCDALEWIASNGGGTIIEDGEVTLDNDNAKAILNQARDWIGTISPTGVTGYQEEDARNVFQGGNAAFMRNWPYCYSLAQSADSAVAGKFDVGPLPHGEGGESSGTLGGWQLAVSNYSDNKEAAIELVKYMASAEVVKWRGTVASFVPLIASVAEDPEVIANQPYMQNLASVTRVTRPSQPTGANYNQVSTEFFQGVNEILTGGDAEEIVPTIAERIERIVG